MVSKERKNRFYHLPNELIIYIYSYDSTYKKKYDKCLHDLLKIFQISRINDRILGEMNIYNIYAHSKISNINIYGNCLSFSKYILQRIKIYGDQVPNDNLKYYNLSKCVI